MFVGWHASSDQHLISSHHHEFSLSRSLSPSFTLSLFYFLLFPPLFVFEVFSGENLVLPIRKGHALSRERKGRNILCAAVELFGVGNRLPHPDVVDIFYTMIVYCTMICCLQIKSMYEYIYIYAHKFRGIITYIWICLLCTFLMHVFVISFTHAQ